MPSPPSHCENEADQILSSHRRRKCIGKSSKKGAKTSKMGQKGRLRQKQVSIPLFSKIKRSPVTWWNRANLPQEESKGRSMVSESARGWEFANISSWINAKIVRRRGREHLNIAGKLKNHCSRRSKDIFHYHWKTTVRLAAIIEHNSFNGSLLLVKNLISNKIQPSSLSASLTEL